MGEHPLAIIWLAASTPCCLVPGTARPEISVPASFARFLEGGNLRKVGVEVREDDTKIEKSDTIMTARWVGALSRENPAWTWERRAGGLRLALAGEEASQGCHDGGVERGESFRVSGEENGSWSAFVDSAQELRQKHAKHLSLLLVLGRVLLIPRRHPDVLAELLPEQVRARIPPALHHPHTHVGFSRESAPIHTYFTVVSCNLSTFFVAFSPPTPFALAVQCSTGHKTIWCPSASSIIASRSSPLAPLTPTAPTRFQNSPRYRRHRRKVWGSQCASGSCRIPHWWKW